jgi:hypothetical protein
MDYSYENRIVIFIDILGFKSIISNTVATDGSGLDEKIKELIESLNLIRDSLKHNSDNGIQDETRKITHFSDSIIISFREDQEGEVYNTLYTIQKLLVLLISKRILCRGAISYGKMIHTDQYVFGPALNKAYETETKAALYPRIILDKSIINIGVKYHYINNTSFEEGIAIKHLLQRDSDDMYYIDYFLNPEPALINLTDLGPYIENLRDFIKSGLNIDHPDIRIKYNWMKNKFNAMVNKWKAPLGQIFLKCDNSLREYKNAIEYISD